MRSGTKKRMELEERMRKVLFSTMIPMACLMIILLFIFWQYTGQYNKLSENLAVSSEFNLRFKDDLDLEMYYIAIGSKESSNLEDVLEQVEDAQEIMQKLRRNTYNNNGVKSLNSLDSYLENLRQRMLQLVEIKEYDKRMEFMDSNIRIITGLIMQEMQMKKEGEEECRSLYAAIRRRQLARKEAAVALEKNRRGRRRT